jgi:hypothetical protein
MANTLSLKAWRASEGFVSFPKLARPAPGDTDFPYTVQDSLTFHR